MKSAEERNMAQYDSFRMAVKAAKHPIALAGAGLSAASGIPTFRGAGGLWRQHDAMSLATPQAFHSDPGKVWQFYHYRREVCLKSKPNQAHLLLSSLSTEKVAKQVFPLAKDGFHFITQNVDGLSIRAGESISHLQPRPPIEMHGSLFRVRCTSCNTESSNFDSPIAKALSGTEDVSREYKAVPVTDLPRCQNSNCGGLLRPGVVWFGESIPALSKISTLLERCDLLLVLGTSSTVYPAAGFATQVQAQGGKAAVFNVEEAGENADWFFEGGVEQTLAKALDLETLTSSQL